MNPTPDDARIRELFQRLKRADEQAAPPFDDVLARTPRPEPAVRHARWVAASGIAALLLTALLVKRSQLADAPGKLAAHTNQSTRPAPLDPIHPASPSHNAVASIDFDHLRQTVADYFGEQPVVRVWSSNTETLLTLNLSSTQE